MFLHALGVPVHTSYAKAIDLVNGFFEKMEQDEVYKIPSKHNTHNTIFDKNGRRLFVIDNLHGQIFVSLGKKYDKLLDNFQEHNHLGFSQSKIQTLFDNLSILTLSKKGLDFHKFKLTNIAILSF